ncbi:hypothetical protein [Candidatus Magnetomonas plexicatena]|uniref:hypothetical protein n=1 Tax=Candidatus Magnetomonas plexicatena TaxID=2552947 RepID=UPI0010FFEC9C|nr:hypothetical protein E2O03_007910 [Nitrospirales bacterium LBB_01]
MPTKLGDRMRLGIRRNLMKKNILLQLLFLVLLPSIVVAASSFWDSLVWDTDKWDSSDNSTTTTTAIGGTTTTKVSTTTTTVNIDNITGSAKSKVIYSLPYFHTEPSAVTYCILSNQSSDNTSAVTFAVKANSASNAAGTVNTFPSAPLYAKMTQMLTFSGYSVTCGNSAIDLTSELSGATSYGGVLSIYSTGTALNCTNITISCFQGTTTPRRNLAGYLCQDNSTAGSAGKSIVVGY